VRPKSSTDWLEPPDLRTATRAQREIAEACETNDRIGPFAIVAGADVSMKWRDSRGPIDAALAPLIVDGRRPLPPATARVIPRFPYVPGYLGFREAPALVAAWDTLVLRGDPLPDLLFVDGQGRAHPRRCGVATQLGVLIDRPTIGLAKSLLCGVVDGDVGPAPGDRAPVVDRGEIVAMALRTRAGATPVFVSIGHRISLDTAVSIALSLSDNRRILLPIRLAHGAANHARRALDDSAPSA